MKRALMSLFVVLYILSVPSCFISKVHTSPIMNFPSSHLLHAGMMHIHERETNDSRFVLDVHSTMYRALTAVLLQFVYIIPLFFLFKIIGIYTDYQRNFLLKHIGKEKWRVRIRNAIISLIASFGIYAWLSHKEMSPTCG